MVAVFLTASAVEAGTWHLTSGPVYTCNATVTGNLIGPRGLYPTPYASTIPSGAYGTLTETGTATMTYTWTPATGTQESHPATAIVQDTVTEHGYPFLGFTGTMTGTGTPPTPLISYRMVPVTSNTLTVTSPPMSAYYTVTSASGDAVAETSIAYSSQVSSPSIDLTGTTPDASGNQNILVGQGCTASLSGIPTGCTASNYQWSVTGNTFQSWTVAVDNSGNPNSATLVSGLGPTTNPTAHWYWSDAQENKTVTCTATITPPAGQGSPFSVTVTKTVYLNVPVTTEVPTVGRVQINNLAQAIYGPGYSLYVGGNANQNYGIIYTTQVNTPALFSAGIWNMVQLVTPNTWYTPFGQAEQANTGNGVQGLDTRYPFYPTSNPSFPSGVPANNVRARPYDGPGIANLQNTIIRYRVSDSYSTYVMFLPPGSDTQWVPLWLITWGWNADDFVPVIWPNWNNAIDAGVVRVSSNANTLLFPQWNTVAH